MNEASFCDQLQRDLKLQIGGAVVIKHADRATVGIPDISVTWRGRTSWIEVKYLRDDELKTFPKIKPVDVLGDMAQVMMVYRLGHSGIAYYLLYTKEYIIFLDAFSSLDWVRQETEFDLPRYDNPYNALDYGTKAFYMKRTPSMPALITVFKHGKKGYIKHDDELVSNGEGIPPQEQPEF